MEGDEKGGDTSSKPASLKPEERKGHENFQGRVTFSPTSEDNQILL